MNDKDYHEYCNGDFLPDDIVISGIAGRFPLCDNVGELYQAMMEKKNLIIQTNERFEKGVYELPFSSCGLVNNLDKFDAEFFNMPTFTVESTDPGQRKLLEISYEALVDAGYDPACELRGLHIGVYTAVTNEDAKDLLTGDFKASLAVGYLRTMNANRCSSAFDFHGPSFTVDSACSSSNVALTLAVNDIRHGLIDAALINSVELCISPTMTYRYHTCGMISETATSRPFDASANGMVRTEAITAMFVQRTSEARRAYAKIIGIKQESTGYEPEGIFVPSWRAEAKLFKEVIRETGVDISDIDYIESHGTGTFRGDPVEVKAIESVYCKDRKKPLYIGSIKSNVGHTEASSGACGIIKAILAFETGIIPPNYYYETPNPECPALISGDIKVVADPVPLTAPCIPVNAFGIGGSITHVILKQNPRKSSNILPKLNRLVLFPATTEEAVRFLFEYIKNHPKLTHEFFALLNKLSFAPTSTKAFRGFALLRDEQAVTLIKKCNRQKRQIWFIMTGMGCQWPGMGLEMMKIDVFASSMMKSASVLKQFGIDLFDLLQKDKNHLQVTRCITPAFVSIVAIQIALVDVLRTLKIEPDGIIGHSTGELICAYADGCCTAEQTILSAYWRGKATETTNLVHGAMAAIGLTWEEAIRRCPAGVYPACHNADDSVTISGLTEPVEKFVAELQAEEVFARVVNAYDYAFHCEYVWPASHILRSALFNIITDPQPRSQKWISTSYQEEEWETENCKFAGTEYFVHNLMSTVLFNEALKKIPRNAITIEIGPHFLLQSILKRSIGLEASYIALMKKNNVDNVGFFLESLGKLYAEGADPRIEYLYPPVKFPVPRGTPMISDLIKWDHSQSFIVPVWRPITGSYIHRFHVDGTDNYLMDHFIDGKALFPATGYIFLACAALAKKLNKKFYEMNVEIEDFKIHRATILGASGKKAIVHFIVTILDITGSFEIEENKAIVASGKVHERQNLLFCKPSPVRTEASEFIPGGDIYNELRIHGYEYGPAFRRLVDVNLTGTEGFVEWNDNWITFMDALLLFYMFTERKSNFVLPTGALNIKISPSILKNNLENHKNKDIKGALVNFYADTMICRTQGVEIKRLEFDSAPQHVKPDNSILEEYKFVPYHHKYFSSEKEQHLIKYMTAINKLLGDMENHFNIDLNTAKFSKDYEIDFDINNTIDDLNEDYVLLNTLKELSKYENKSDLDRSRKDTFLKFYSKIGKDILNTFLVDEHCLKIVFDIIAENSVRKLDVLEINKNFITVLPTVVNCFEKYSLVKFKSKNLVSDASEDLDTLNNHNIQQYPSEKLRTVIRECRHDVIITSISTGTGDEIEEYMQMLNSAVADRGFIVLFHKNSLFQPENFVASFVHESISIVPHTVLEKIFEMEHLVVICKISDNFGGNLYLLRHALPENKLRLIRMTESDEWFEELKTSVSSTPDNIWLLSENSPNSGIIGMVNCLRNEPEGERLRCIFIPERTETMPPFDFTHPFYEELLKKDLLMNVWKDGTWGSFKHVEIKTVPEAEVENCYLHIKKYGDLSSMQWMESPIKYSDIPDDSLVYISYSALNFKDVMIATGKLSHQVGRVTTGDALYDDCVLGLEYAGLTKEGKRVAGVCASMGIATATKVCPESYFEIPDSMSMQEAATIPTVYLTCYYALITRANLQNGESILIHSGTGGIGLAAINLALSMNCEIFTTVGNEQKREFLLETFPQIKSKNIGCSRDITFEVMIMESTKGRGVDVVLNSLADDKFYASVRCVAKHGRYVEIGKYDLALDHKIGLKCFLKNITFIGVCVDQIFENSERNRNFLKNSIQLVQKGINSGVVKPIKYTTFNYDEAEKAFRYMASGSHIGKVLLKMRDAEEMFTMPRSFPIIPVTYFYARKVYIIIGGLGGFGIEVANWILSKGAKTVVLTSRFGARTPYHHLCLRRWKNEGYNVVVSTRDVSIEDECLNLLKEVAHIGPVGGIFNSAVILDDAFLENCTIKGFREVCAPKADATRNLDILSRPMCKELDHFVCFSSISCGRGNAGQMNYGYANSVMERICEQRRTEGLPGLAIQWGIIGEVGVVHRHMGDDAMIAGVGAQKVKSCLHILDITCQTKCPVVSSYVLKDPTRRKGIQGDMLQQLAKIFGLKDASEFNNDRCFSEMGVDSMTGVEIKYLLESACDVTFTMKEIQEMKMSDVKVLLEKIESERKDKSSTLVSTTKKIEIPKSFIHPQALLPLNENRNECPVCIIDVDSSDLLYLHSLGKAMNNPVFALLWSSDTPTSSLEAIASWYLKKIKEISEKEIHIVAYRSASVLAFEMVKQNWKSHKNIKTLTIIDGSSYLVKTANKKKENRTNDEILFEFINNTVPEADNKIQYELAAAGGLDNKIRISIDMFFSHSSDKAELTRIIHSNINKMKLLDDYKPQEKLSQDLMLIEDSSQLLANDVAEVKSALSKICSGKLTIQRIPDVANFSEEGMKNIISIFNSVF